jgi:secondary thiamine-phosphate synthase enzyme
MKVITDSFSVSTKSRNQLIDVTDKGQAIVTKSGIKNGDVIVYCPHTTAGITINENADPDVVYDLLQTLSEIVPADKTSYRHSEGNSDAHCKSSIIGCSKQLLIENSRLILGTWQGIYFCEFDGPRSRKVYVQARGENE